MDIKRKLERSWRDCLQRKLDLQIPLLIDIGKPDAIKTCIMEGKYSKPAEARKSLAILDPQGAQKCQWPKLFKWSTRLKFFAQRPKSCANYFYPSSQSENRRTTSVMTAKSLFQSEWVAKWMIYHTRTCCRIRIHIKRFNFNNAGDVISGMHYCQWNLKLRLLRWRNQSELNTCFLTCLQIRKGQFHWVKLSKTSKTDWQKRMKKVVSTKCITRVQSSYVANLTFEAFTNTK